MEAKHDKRRNYLKKQIYLSPEEKIELQHLENLKQEWLEEVNKRFTERPKQEVKPSPKINASYVGYWFKKFWEFQNKKELIINLNNQQIINALCLYFARDPRFETDLKGLAHKVPKQEFSLNKGILICGNVGTGKSSMLEALRLLGDTYYKEFEKTSLLFWKHNCKQIVSSYMDKYDAEGKNLKKYYKGSIPLYFDDLGTEEIAFNGGYNVMADILEARYEAKSKTFITSNLGLRQIEERYGLRVRDRIDEMFNIIPISGESFRK